MPADPMAQHAELLARLDAADDPYGLWAAVRAVVELHAPRPSGTITRTGPAQCGECADRCHSGSGLSCEYPGPDAPYPCATVQAVAEHVWVRP